ncbi:MAG: GNAT family N-acetyltransferase [Anaerolineae bacterium]|nr:GNAT family N-acetyltransferase [Anaerolineae bacterium]
MDDLILRELHTMPEFTALSQLQQTIWGMIPGDTTSPHVMSAVTHNGGLVIGAEVAGQLVGFCFAFVGWDDGGRYLWSHMAGVLPEFHGRGIGLGLKYAQREWALDRGFTEIRWTFDPMQPGNANFNFHLLGGSANTYHVNIYGVMTDKINAGLASDRLEVHWQLQDERVIALAEKRHPDESAVTPENAPYILRIDHDQALIRAPESAFTDPVYLIELPCHVKRSDREAFQRWQLALRCAMQTAFEQGYSIIDFIRRGERAFYVLRHD